MTGRYGDAATTLEALPRLCREERARRRLSLRRAAHEIGVSHQAVFLLEHGKRSQIGTLIAVLRWIESTDRTRHTSVTRSPPIANADRVTPA